MKYKHEKKELNAKSVTAEMRGKAIFASCLFCVSLFGLIIYNLYMLQFVNDDTYKRLAASQQLSDIEISPHRGTIYDANMKVIARSSTVWTIVASPADMKNRNVDINMVAMTLAEILELEAQEILQKLQDTNSAYKIIANKVEKPQADAITLWINEYNNTDAGKQGPISGIILEPDTKRYYPYSNMASTVVGFTSSDGVGLTGLELYYNDLLTGTPGRIVTARNAWGYEMDGDYRAEYPAENGYSIVTTIDEVVQQTLEKYLANAISDHNVANRGAGIVMNVKTGEILAMATLPDYDLNNPYELYDEELAAQIAAIVNEEERTAARQTAQQSMWRNKAVQDIYEPGSVFKTVTASAALDSGVANANTSFSCAGGINVVSGVYMRCAHPEGHGTLDFYGGLNHSCNPYFIQLSWLMGAQIFTDYLELFGFYEKTGIDLPNEAQTNAYSYENMKITELSSSSFGQSTQTTPIAMLTALAAIANDGQLMEPYIVKQVLDENGNIVENYEPVEKRQVISEETSNAIVAMMEESVANGQNQYAYVKGYRVAGKSGTSQKQTVVEGNEEDTLRISSFAGFAPADDPEIAVIIVLDEPHDEFNSFGGRLCGPVVGAIMADVLPYMGIEPQYTEEDLLTIEETVPNLTGLTVLDANTKLNSLGFSANEVGGGTSVTYQYPAAGTVLGRQSVVVLYTDEGAQGVNVVVPDVTGQSVEQARQTLNASGLNMAVVGFDDESAHVQAVSQNIDASSEITMGSVVEVLFHSTTTTD